MKYIAGIDGGGTKTTMELRSLDNSLLAKKTFGPFNINSTGEEQFQALLRDLFRELTPITNCSCICIGAAGSSNPQVHKMITQTLANYGFTGILLLKGDHEIALQGALGKDEGIILISGTGSICYGRDATGKIARAGGWGHLIDDGGSAYRVARDGFAAVMQSIDGRIGPTLLKDYFFRKLEINTPEEVIPFLYHPQTDKRKIAAFAPLVEQAAAKGDLAALDIIDQNASLLMDLIKAVVHQLSIPKAKVALLGGMMSHDTLLKKTVIERINSDLKLTFLTAQEDAVAGACAMALDAVATNAAASSPFLN